MCTSAIVSVKCPVLQPISRQCLSRNHSSRSTDNRGSHHTPGARQLPIGGAGIAVSVSRSLSLAGTLGEEAEALEEKEEEETLVSGSPQVMLAKLRQF
jgi:hypothetical protein